MRHTATAGIPRPNPRRDFQQPVQAIETRPITKVVAFGGEGRGAESTRVRKSRYLGFRITSSGEKEVKQGRENQEGFDFDDRGAAPDHFHLGVSRLGTSDVKLEKPKNIVYVLLRWRTNARRGTCCVGLRGITSRKGR